MSTHRGSHLHIWSRYRKWADLELLLRNTLFFLIYLVRNS